MHASTSRENLKVVMFTRAWQRLPYVTAYLPCFATYVLFAFRQVTFMHETALVLIEWCYSLYVYASVAGFILDLFM